MVGTYGLTTQNRCGSRFTRRCPVSTPIFGTPTKPLSASNRVGRYGRPITGLSECVVKAIQRLKRQWPLLRRLDKGKYYGLQRIRTQKQNWRGDFRWHEFR